jgi:hypothetical protein
LTIWTEYGGYVSYANFKYRENIEVIYHIISHNIVSHKPVSTLQFSSEQYFLL